MNWAGAYYVIPHMVAPRDTKPVDSLDFGNSLVAIVQRLGVLRQQRHDEEVAVLLEVIDEGRNSVRVDRLLGVQQHERDRLVDIVGEITRQPENQPRHLAFALREVLDDVLVGRS